MARFRVTVLPKGGYKLTATYHPRGGQLQNYLGFAATREEIPAEFRRIHSYLGRYRQLTMKYTRSERLTVPYNSTAEDKSNGLGG